MILISLLNYMSLICPKCGGLSWIEIQHTIPIQCCRCGLTKVLQFKSDGMIMTRSPTREHNFTLPTAGTQLAKILGCLFVFGDMSSKQVADNLRISRDKATTNLSVLRSRGLIRPIVERRGKDGGSTWTLEAAIKKHYEKRN